MAGLMNGDAAQASRTDPRRQSFSQQMPAQTTKPCGINGERHHAATSGQGNQPGRQAERWSHHRQHRDSRDSRTSRDGRR